jgi:hypothetical protein
MLVPLVVLLAALVAVPSAYLLATSTADGVLEQRQEERIPCPGVDSVIHPSEIRLAPGIVQHQNWVEFPVPRRFAGTYALCLDGRRLASGGGILDFSSGSARFNIATRSVNLYWLGRELDELLEPARWELRLQCAPDFRCE